MTDVVHVSKSQDSANISLYTVQFADCIFSISETYEQKRQEHTTELLKKEEEMRQTFVIKVKEKEAELKDSERDVISLINESLYDESNNFSFMPSEDSNQPWHRSILIRVHYVLNA